MSTELPPKSRRQALLKSNIEQKPVESKETEISIPEILGPVYDAVDSNDSNALTIALNELTSQDLTMLDASDLRTMMETCSASKTWSRKHSQIYSRLAAVTPSGSYDIVCLGKEESSAPVGSKEDALINNRPILDEKPLDSDYEYSLWFEPSIVGLFKIISSVNPEPYISFTLDRDIDSESQGAHYQESPTPEKMDSSKSYPCRFTISETNSSRSIQENVDFDGYFQGHDDGVFRRVQHFFRPKLPTLLAVIDGKAGHRLQLVITRGGVLRCILHDTRTKMTTSFSLDSPMPKIPEDAGDILNHLRYNFVLRASWLHSILKMGSVLDGTTLFPVVRELPAIAGKPRLLRLSLLMSNRMQYCTTVSEYDTMCMDDKSVVQEGQITVATYVDNLDDNLRGDDVVTNVHVDTQLTDTTFGTDELEDHWKANSDAIELMYFQGFPMQSIELFISKLGSNMVEMRIGTGKPTADRPEPEKTNVMIFFVNHEKSSITLTYNFASGN